MLTTAKIANLFHYHALAQAKKTAAACLHPETAKAEKMVAKVAVEKVQSQHLKKHL
jgi:hypothetical protein